MYIHFILPESLHFKRSEFKDSFWTQGITYRGNITPEALVKIRSFDLLITLTTSSISNYKS
jgi:hypothetical protein